jgi:aspartate aminotransferase
MPKISNKGAQMPESPMQISTYSEIAKKGNKVWPFEHWSLDKTPEVAIEVTKILISKILEYSHLAGFESYRNKLSQFYKNTGLLYIPRYYHLNRWSEALLLQWEVQWIKGTKSLFQNRFMQIYNDFHCIRCMTVVPVISSIDTGFALPPIADFEKLITPKTKAILICNPGNPVVYLH